MSEDPLVVRRMREWKQMLLAREAREMQQMAHEWLGIEERLDAALTALASETAQMRAGGQAVTESRLYQVERYRQLVAQVRDELRRYSAYAQREIERGQRELARWGVDQAGQAIDAVYQEAGIRFAFNRLPVEATEYMVGSTREGAPLGDLLRQRMIAESGAFERLTRALVDGTARGWNPRKTARAMADGLTGGLDKALTIARSEQMRVYRMAANDQYQASGVVTGVRRLSAHDDRVCVACLADDGTEYELGTMIDDHPNGRCTGIPIVAGLPEVDWTKGEEWLKAQGEDVQRAVLGPGRYELWRGGRVPFSAFGQRHEDETWGGSVTPIPLEQLEA